MLRKRMKLARFLTDVIILYGFLFGWAPVAAQQTFFRNSYALVIGINQYRSEHWKNLRYAVKDAQGMSRYLQRQGFKVNTLYNLKATKAKIVAMLTEELARRVGEEDRVLVFFSGHGHTERLDGRDWGYIVPSDGTESSSTYISMEELQRLSEKIGDSRHQLFIMDACYGGLMGRRNTGEAPAASDYPGEMARRRARQILTAGGKDQQVIDGGPGGYSYFTGCLLEALQQGMADSNQDDYITFRELGRYLVSQASNRYATPETAFLSGHEQGEFFFQVPVAVQKQLRPSPPLSGVTKGRAGISMVPPKIFRATPVNALNNGAVKAMLEQREFYDSDLNETGAGFANQYEERHKGKVIYDRASGLMWQQSGCPKYVSYSAAGEYIAELNRKQFSGYKDWRLPTLEEAMSLVEAEKIDGFYINPCFDRRQWWIWVADRQSDVGVWGVDFRYGACSLDGLGLKYYVRAVRSGE